MLIQEGIDAYIPDNSFEVEKRGKTKWFMKSLFRYDEKKDCYYCPAGIVMPFEKLQKRQDKPDLKFYGCKFYSQCVLKNACTKAENLTVSSDPREHVLVNMRIKLKTKGGKDLYQERMSTVEPVFGQMKQNRGFREFLLRGKKNAKVEFLMMCVVHKYWKDSGSFEKKWYELERNTGKRDSRGQSNRMWYEKCCYRCLKPRFW